ncbi:DUF805 domain-containing protein [Lentilactobacillus senioris]|uniref:DUF805 domain-containing protein n=1 Tax=Lentilactobacillus senioris TaxID=931534 RepID=UPI002281F09D|nr:DUF805 domain-containing protein [Lentilactobacillus senioris]MCY9807410.1 DUF805 domain-containing protein [Lentilactobacillus senioris]
MIESYKRFWSNLGNFSGTANRPDYWWPMFLNYILAIVVVIIADLITGHSIDSNVMTWSQITTNLVVQIVFLVVWFGTLSVKFRRLHDTDHSGWWILISIIPIIGTIWFFILMVLPSKPNRWSDNYVAED